MGFFDTLKADKIAAKAQRTHSDANELQKRGKPNEAAAKYQEAAVLYKQAREAGSKRTNNMMGEAILMMRFGKFEEARAIMQTVSKECKLDEQTHFELRCDYAICLWHLGLLDKAIEIITYAGNYAKNSTYYAQLCTFLIDKLRKTGEGEEQVHALLDEAMEYDDEDAATLDNYGEYWRVKYEQATAAGNTEAAAQARANSVDFFKKAYARKPNQITTLYALAKIAEEDGDKTRAAEYLDKAIIHWSSRACAVSIEQLKEARARL